MQMPYRVEAQPALGCAGSTVRSSLDLAHVRHDVSEPGLERALDLREQVVEYRRRLVRLIAIQGAELITGADGLQEMLRLRGGEGSPSVCGAAGGEHGLSPADDAGELVEHPLKLGPAVGELWPRSFAVLADPRLGALGGEDQLLHLEELGAGLGDGLDQAVRIGGLRGA